MHHVSYIYVSTVFYFISGGNIAGLVSDTVVAGSFILLLLCAIKSILCFTQFSALYPEMVDAVVLLDSYGFLPTDLVLKQF